MNSDTINLIWTCRDVCQTTFFSHCLESGGDHLNPSHVKIMLDCIAICQVTADSLRRSSPMHAYICKLTALVCDQCAKSCEAVGGMEMQNCAKVCRDCAASCRDMAI